MEILSGVPTYKSPLLQENWAHVKYSVNCAHKRVSLEWYLSSSNGFNGVHECDATASKSMQVSK